jgi:hypothetical protein
LDRLIFTVTFKDQTTLSDVAVSLGDFTPLETGFPIVSYSPTGGTVATPASFVLKLSGTYLNNANPKVLLEQGQTTFQGTSLVPSVDGKNLQATFTNIPGGVYTIAASFDD